MAEPTIKMEPQESQSPLPEWKRCEGENLHKQVIIKEIAARNGTVFLNRLRITLQNHQSLISGCKPRIDKIDTIRARRKEFRVLIGFLGVTGSGKSTLINALIGYKHLLPTSDERAATAVPVEVSYNKSDDVDALFRAEIVFVTVQEWREELQQLFTDLAPARSNAQLEDEEEDEERDRRINITLDKMKYVYPHIRSVEKLKTMSVEILLNEKDIRDALGTTRHIRSATRGQFSSAIRGYIDSGESNGNVSACWPLVKLVKLYVKSTLLETGIVLLDLPGNLDSNSARAIVAEGYHKELAVTCIVANADRGISAQNAHELLEKVTKRNLQLDGLFNAESLCFILSKTDAAFDVIQYIKDHPDLAASCRVDENLAMTHKNSIQELKRQLKITQSSYASNGRIVKSHSGQIRELQARLDGMSADIGSTGQKRKFMNEHGAESTRASRASDEQVVLRNQIAQLKKRLADAKSLVSDEATKLASFNKRINFLETAQWFARSRLSATCIKNRNKLSSAAIRKDYENTLHEMRREVTEPLRVFCTAAYIHLKYLSTTKRSSGFPNLEDTQIPAFRDWLISTTLKTRHSYAQAFLEDVDNLVTSMQPWINDTYSDMKMPPELREVLEPQLKSSVEELQKKFLELSTKSTRNFKQIVSTSLYSVLPEAERQAAKKSTKTAEKWAVGLHWSTHRTINRNMGKWKDSKRRDHQWNEELAVDLTTPIVAEWDQTFYRQLPAAFAIYVEDAKKLIVDFALIAADRDMCHDVADAIDTLRDNILKARNLLQRQTESGFEEFKKNIRKTHRRASPAIRDFLEPMYTQCGNEGGAGHYGRNKETHLRMMEDRGVDMHQTASKEMRAAIDEMLNNILGNLTTGYEAALTQIQEDLVHFFDRNTSNGYRNSGRKVVSTSKIKLQKDAMAHFDDLATHWLTKTNLAPVREIADSEDELDDDDLFDLDLGEQDDDYDE